MGRGVWGGLGGNRGCGGVNLVWGGGFLAGFRG